MPSSAKDRFTVDFEYMFFFVKQGKYWFEQQFDDTDEIIGDCQSWDTPKRNVRNKENRNYTADGKRNKRTVWNMATQPFPDAHYAVYPEELIVTPIKAGCPEGGIVLDPFIGSGTTAIVSLKLNRQFIGFELSQDNVDMSNKRLKPLLEQGKLF